MKRPILHQQGFTLLEAIIALAILSIGVLAAAAMQGHAIRASTTSYNRTGADSVAMTFVEAMQSMPFDKIGDEKTLLFDGNGKMLEETRKNLAVGQKVSGNVYTWGSYKQDLLTKLTKGVVSKGAKDDQVCDQSGKCYSMVWSIKNVGSDQAKVLRLLMVWDTPYGSNHLAYTTTLQNNTKTN